MGLNYLRRNAFVVLTSKTPSRGPHQIAIYMTGLFLKAKHWHLFTLIFVIPMLFQIGLMGVVLGNFRVGEVPDPAVAFGYMKFLPVILFIYMGFLLGWYWSMAVGLQAQVPAEVTMNVKKFKLFFFATASYFFFAMTLAATAFTLPELHPLVILAIIPFHFLAMFGMFYMMYFVAKTYKTVELQREVKFVDFMGEFFMIWFFPIGIWIMQPKINAMAVNGR